MTIRIGLGAAAAGSLLPAVHAAMGPNDKFDLLIKGGDVLDPSQRLRGIRDIGICNGVEGPAEFVDTRNNTRTGKVYLRPVQTVAAGIAFGRPYAAPFSVR